MYVNPHDDEGNSYSFAFACVCDKKTAPNSISEDKKIDYLYYNPTDTNVWVHYSASADKPQGEDKQLGNDEEVYIGYYKDPSTVPIYYKDMAPSGGLTDTTVDSQAPVVAGIHQTPYEMKDFVYNPRSWANKTNSNDFYSFAIGDPNADNASQLHTITQDSNSDSDGSRPNLQVMNTWRGYKYSVDGGRTWNDAGYDIALYVVYYDSQPTIVNLNEKTIGLAGDMSKEFTYTVKITETTTTQTIRNYYNDNYYVTSEILDSNNNTKTTSYELRLSDGIFIMIALVIVIVM